MYVAYTHTCATEEKNILTFFLDDFPWVLTVTSARIFRAANGGKKGREEGQIDREAGQIDIDRGAHDYVCGIYICICILYRYICIYV